MMSNQTLEDKLGLLKQLILVANADGKIKEAEYQLLLGLAAQMGVSKEEFEKVFETGVEISLPKNDADRILQFHRMILMLNVDADASPVEIDMVRKMGIMLGLNPQAIELVLEEMKTYPNNLIPPDRMVQIFTKYMN
jgi:uncharacterized tellurite resistance protein B-like protein